MTEMNDVELAALTALVDMTRMLCAAENESRLLQGFSPAWTTKCAESDEEAALREELVKRGVLKQKGKT